MPPTRAHLELRASGVRHFFTDQSGVIRFNVGSGADLDSDRCGEADAWLAEKALNGTELVRGGSFGENAGFCEGLFFRGDDPT